MLSISAVSWLGLPRVTFQPETGHAKIQFTVPDTPREEDGNVPTVSVIVTTYRRSERLEACLRPLLDDPATTELIVVVDGYDDQDAVDVVGRFASADKRVVLVQIPHGGQRAAHSAGLAKATAEVVLIMDDDVVAGAGLVSGHARHHHGADGLVVAGYMPCWETPLANGVLHLTRAYAAEYEMHCSQYETDPSAVLREHWGGNVSLRRHDCVRVGFPPWPYRHEDQEFGLRCLRNGLSGVFDRTLYAQHRYTRGASRFLDEARSYAFATAFLHAQFPDLLGPFDPDHDLRRRGTVVRLLASRVVRPLTSLLPARQVRGLVTKPLVAVAGAAGRWHLSWMESWTFSVAAWIESLVGVREFRSQEPLLGVSPVTSRSPLA